MDGMELEQGGAPAAEPGEEVTLREFTLSDADAEVFMSWASDPRVARFKRRDPYEHVDQARRYIAAHVLPHPWYRAICAGGVVVGSISVKPAAPAEDWRRPFRARTRAAAWCRARCRQRPGRHRSRRRCGRRRGAAAACGAACGGDAVVVPARQLAGNAAVVHVAARRGRASLPGHRRRA